MAKATAAFALDSALGGGDLVQEEAAAKVAELMLPFLRDHAENLRAVSG